MDFEILVISRILCILMFLIIAFIKSFKNEMLVVFLDIFGHENKFETSFENFFGNLFF
jgi:hypothetical protein